MVDFGDLTFMGMIAGLITAVMLYIKAESKYKAFKETVQKLAAALEDDKITVDELKGILEAIRKLVMD